jgi:hypothetical protein
MMPSDQMLAELSQDPRTIAYRAERLAAWADDPPPARRVPGVGGEERRVRVRRRVRG